MEKLTKIIAFPFWLIVMLLAGCVIIYHEEKEYRAQKRTERCQHPEQTDVVVNSVATCETVHTICDHCTTVLHIKIEC